MTVAIVEHSDSLTLTADQDYWNDKQLAALRHMGVEHAGDGDLAVFHHVCTRTGLDPFAKQIYMIGRQSSENVNGEWVKTMKYTIQTGIDGFRLIGRRAANQTKETISLSAPEWAHEDGSWRPVWRSVWGSPVAARVTIKRHGEAFEAVALFDEYKQTKRNGELTSMWQQRPAGQIAKCAEALAWRMAFPQDLSGIYTDDEMGQANNDVRQSAAYAEQTAPAADRMAAMLGTPQSSGAEPTRNDPESDGSSAPESPTLDMRGKLAKRMFATLNEAGYPDAAEGQREFIEGVVGRKIESRKELTDRDAEMVIDALAELMQQPFPEGEAQA